MSFAVPQSYLPDSVDSHDFNLLHHVDKTVLGFTERLDLQACDLRNNESPYEYPEPHFTCFGIL